jgi:hypothetical protein
VKYGYGPRPGDWGSNLSIQLLVLHIRGGYLANDSQVSPLESLPSKPFAFAASTPDSGEPSTILISTGTQGPALC